jgi:hypothetical protein
MRVRFRSIRFECIGWIKKKKKQDGTAHTHDGGLGDVCGDGSEQPPPGRSILDSYSKQQLDPTPPTHTHQKQAA